MISEKDDPAMAPSRRVRNPFGRRESGLDQLQVLIPDPTWRSPNASDIVGAIKSLGKNT
jgi:hypothetical protein